MVDLNMKKRKELRARAKDKGQKSYKILPLLLALALCSLPFALTQNQASDKGTASSAVDCNPGLVGGTLRSFL